MIAIAKNMAMIHDSELPVSHTSLAHSTIITKLCDTLWALSVLPSLLFSDGRPLT